MSTPAPFPTQARIHMGLAVRDLEASIRFYELLFGEAPIKVRPGYAKFEPADPSVNLSLNEVPDAPPAMHPTAHFGVQVRSTEAVAEATARLGAAGLETLTEEATTCCWAVQDKVWVTDPDGHRWEVFVVLDADAAEAGTGPRTVASPCCPDQPPACCGPVEAESPAEPCCG